MSITKNNSSSEIGNDEKKDVFIEKNFENNNTILYQYIFKIILIGDCNIGKTSLINRYIHNSFKKEYLLTIGVDFMMKTVEIDDKQIKLQIWDTAGMERYKQVTTSYYRGAQAAIVIFDLTKKDTFDNVPKWISGFYEYSNPLYQKHLVIVGNKADLIDERQVSKEAIDNYVKINSFEYIECSALSGQNVDDLFKTIGAKLYENYKSSNINNQRKSQDMFNMKGTVLNSNVSNFENILKKDNKGKCC